MARYHAPEGGDAGDKVFIWIFFSFWVILNIGAFIELFQGRFTVIILLVLINIVPAMAIYMPWASARWEKKSRAKHPERWY